MFHQYTLILEGISDSDGLNEYLADQKISFYDLLSCPGHRQKMFDSFNGMNNHLPVTDWLTERVISLPMHPELDEEQLSYITQSCFRIYVNTVKQHNNTNYDEEKSFNYRRRRFSRLSSLRPFY